MDEIALSETLDALHRRGFVATFSAADGALFVRDSRKTFRPDLLCSLGIFPPDSLNFLGDLRFTGSVRAVAEGTLVFGDELIVEVTAPIIEAQIVETAVLDFVHLQTLLATKASRSVIAARGRTPCTARAPAARQARAARRIVPGAGAQREVVPWRRFGSSSF